ncbi:MAG TPA: MBL fold metallo-hydrolase [Rhizomicrobium sp.]|nr:MBL fold metallo-hydrolase [Rhizomicrobium sp.]
MSAVVGDVQAGRLIFGADAPFQCAIIPVTRVKQNCSVIWCTRTRMAAVIDPGGDLDSIRALLDRNALTLERVLVTHGHVDHAGGAFDLADIMGVPIEGPHRADRFLVERLADNGDLYGMDWAIPYEPARWLGDGDTVRIGNETLEILHCPGHTPGHVAYYHRPSGLAFVGDILFRGLIGNTSMPYSDHRALLRSIHLKLLPLGNHVAFVPGHGPLSTFGEERRTNAVVSDKAKERYEHLIM